MNLNKIKQAILAHWEEDKITFLYEFVGAMFTIAASAILAATAKEPDMLTVYLLYLLGSAIMGIAYIRRGMIWSIVLTAWFTVINIVGLIVLLS